MNWFQKIRRRRQAMFGKRELDAEMEKEMRSHVEMRTQEHIEAGMDAEEARRAAALQFGWTDSIKETCREQRGTGWFDHIMRDVRFGLRQLRKNPGFTLVTAFTL